MHGRGKTRPFQSVQSLRYRCSEINTPWAQVEWMLGRSERVAATTARPIYASAFESRPGRLGNRGTLNRPKLAPGVQDDRRQLQKAKAKVFAQRFESANQSSFRLDLKPLRPGAICGSVVQIPAFFPPATIFSRYRRVGTRQRSLVLSGHYFEAVGTLDRLVRDSPYCMTTQRLGSVDAPLNAIVEADFASDGARSTRAQAMAQVNIPNVMPATQFHPIPRED
ncbi:hypothetical protein DFH06DRAFT_1129956 [Mycena polygramma]|nr:hypothetical protein DFH06DRAFT_1129956 [Mycena polygramma]